MANKKTDLEKQFEDFIQTFPKGISRTFGATKRKRRKNG